MLWENSVQKNDRKLLMAVSTMQRASQVSGYGVKGREGMIVQGGAPPKPSNFNER